MIPSTEYPDRPARSAPTESQPFLLGPAMTVERLGEAVVQHARELTGASYAALFLRVEGSDPPRFTAQTVAGASPSLFSDVGET